MYFEGIIYNKNMVQNLLDNNFQQFQAIALDTFFKTVNKEEKRNHPGSELKFIRSMF